MLFSWSDIILLAADAAAADAASAPVVDDDDDRARSEKREAKGKDKGKEGNERVQVWTFKEMRNCRLARRRIAHVVPRI